MHEKRMLRMVAAPVLPSEQNFRSINHPNGQSSIMHNFDCISNLHNVCPHRSFGNGGRLCLKTAVMKRWRFRLEVCFIEGLGIRVVVVRYDESWGELVLVRVGGSLDEQLSLNARVVNASRTVTMFGCRIRLHISMGVNAA